MLVPLLLTIPGTPQLPAVLRSWYIHVPYSCWLPIINHPKNQRMAPVVLLAVLSMFNIAGISIPIHQPYPGTPTIRSFSKALRSMLYLMNLGAVLDSCTQRLSGAMNSAASMDPEPARRARARNGHLVTGTPGMTQPWWSVG